MSKQDDFVWKAFTNGKKWALAQIYNKNYEELFYYGTKLLSNKSEIEDVIHDLFIKLWNNKANLSQPKNLKAYLFKSFRSLILDYIKVYKNKHSEGEIIDNLTFISISPEEIFINDQTNENNLQRLNQEINKLPNRQKEAIYLHCIREYSYHEVAEIMNLNVHSVRNLVYEAINRLKQKKSLFD